jgi:diguanylate cyclase (GGDEF)-like protein
MLRLFNEPKRWLFLLKTVVPILAAALALFLGASALLVWSARETNRVSIERQHSLVALIVSKLQSGIAHDQESVTVWDDALNAVRRPDSAEWIDVNLGTWMHSYFGHDGSFVLDPENRLIYAFSDGAVAGEPAFQQLMAHASPLVASLRQKLAAGDTDGLTDRILTPGVADLSIASGHPAVISVKPIVSDSGEIEQTPGEEYLHIAVRYLDQSFIADLKQDYLLDGLRFDRHDTSTGDEASSVLRAAGGNVIGYLIWQPYLPGSAVLASVGPVLLAVALIGLAAVALLVAGLRKRSLKLRVSEAAVHHLAHHDPLTGLPNRSQFNDRLDTALKKLRASGEKLAVLYLDLDRFKEVNDTFGHPGGDELLREFADRLRRLTRETDTVARIGGDEFTVILRDVASEEVVEVLCQRVIESARHPFVINGTQAFVGVSVGVALAPRDGLDRVELTRRSDVALYHAKAGGRSEYAIYDSAMDMSNIARRDLERELRLAIDAPGQFEVYYQPLYTAEGGRIAGVEALLRWHHPERGLMSPDAFIPLAEEIGLIEKIGELVLKEACTAAAAWPVDTIAVNVSAVELHSPTFAIRVANTLLATGFNPRRLELEVTESALAEKGGQCEQNVAALRELGIRFALDDFGTGFSSLGRLHQLDVDRIKIDRSFVQGFGKANGDEAIVQAIVDLARATGLKTTAEGVETVSQSDYLRTIGCDELQGFLLSRPLPAAEIEKLWREKGKRLAS